MKKTILSLGLLGVLPFTALAASDNVITFQGEVADQTCEVTVNGEKASPVVLLPTVPASDLAASGDVAGKTSFEIGLSGCTPSTTGTVKISTVFVGNQVTSDGNLGNTGTAGNVDIQILESNGTTAVNFTGGYTGASDLTLATNETSATSTYYAQYYATAAATAGTVQSSLQYAVSYQ